MHSDHFDRHTCSRRGEGSRMSAQLVMTTLDWYPRAGRAQDLHGSGGPNGLPGPFLMIPTTVTLNFTLGQVFEIYLLNGQSDIGKCSSACSLRNGFGPLRSPEPFLESWTLGSLTATRSRPCPERSCRRCWRRARTGTPQRQLPAYSARPGRSSPHTCTHGSQSPTERRSSPRPTGLTQGEVTFAPPGARVWSICTGPAEPTWWCLHRRGHGGLDARLDAAPFASHGASARMRSRSQCWSA
jgi:hypothetical protein